MNSQKVNQFSKKLFKKSPHLFKLGLPDTKPVRDAQTGFIHHPASVPFECKRIWFNYKQEVPDAETANVGLIFQSEKHMKPGVTVEIIIPLRNVTERFRGKVVLVRNLGEYYEIGLWLYRRADANRARIVEQICHIETYLQEKKYREGPYAINRDRVAAEWISKYASSVPTL